jgi:hypothetical protein
MPSRPATVRTTSALVIGVGLLFGVATASVAGEVVSPIFADPQMLGSQESSAYPNGEFSAQLSAASNGAGDGVGGSRHRTGSGSSNWMA